MARDVRLLAVVLSSFMLFSCNGDSPTNGTTTTTAPATTTVPASADIDVEILGLGGGTSNQGNLFVVGIRMTESGGGGANINFARLEIFTPDGQFLERSEIGSGLIIEGLGDNRLEANSSEDITLSFPFRATAKSGRTLLLTIGFTDFNGNDSESMDDFVIL